MSGVDYVEGDRNIEAGAAIVRFFASLSLNWTERVCEPIDNAIDADATRIDLVFEGGYVTIKDNGHGCDDMKMMQSICRTRRAAYSPKGRPRASMFGVGAPQTQVNITGGGSVEITSITSDAMFKYEVDWGKCLAEDKLEAGFNRKLHRPKGASTGVTIRMRIGDDRRPRQKDYDNLIRDLSYRYAGMLQGECSITLAVDGDKTRIRPFLGPPLAEQLDREIDHEGHRVRIRGGMVKRGQPNPFPGFSFRKANRTMGIFNGPAPGIPVNRVYFVVDLPQSWENITPNKDGFKAEPTALMKAIGDECRWILDAAKQEAEQVEMNSTKREVERRLADRLNGGKQGTGVKGARPGVTGRKGAADPTGGGSEHRRFTTAQPGDKASGEESRRSNLPSLVKYILDETMDVAYKIDPSGDARGRVLILTLNPTYKSIAAIKDDADGMEAFILSLVAREMADGKKGIREMFPPFRDAEYAEALATLLGPPAPARDAKPKPRRRAS